MISYSTICRTPGGDIPVIMNYDENEPMATSFEFFTPEGEISWTFAFDILISALAEGRAGIGDVKARAMEDVFLMRLTSPDGNATIQFKREFIEEFVDMANDSMTSDLASFKVTDEAIEAWLDD
jgi:hypothetical protein